MHKMQIADGEQVEAVGAVVPEAWDMAHVDTWPYEIAEAGDTVLDVWA
jgi:hypothetical protein